MFRNKFDFQETRFYERRFLIIIIPLQPTGLVESYEI